MILHKNKSLFKEAVTIAAQQLNLPAVYIEKDYWITFLFHTTFHKSMSKIGSINDFNLSTIFAKLISVVNLFRSKNATQYF